MVFFGKKAKFCCFPSAAGEFPAFCHKISRPQNPPPCRHSGGRRKPDIHHRRFDKGDCPIRTDLGETRSKNIKQILYGKQEGKCNLCKNHMAIQYFHVDHIVPRAKGGPDCDRNLQLLCAPCSTVKSTRTMETAYKKLRQMGYV